jgi:hypothetical protein
MRFWIVGSYAVLVCRGRNVCSYEIKTDILICILQQHLCQFHNIYPLFLIFQGGLRRLLGSYTKVPEERLGLC